MSKIIDQLSEENPDVRQLAPGVRAFVPEGEEFNPSEHVVQVDPRRMPRMHYVDGELTNKGILRLNIRSAGRLEDLDLLWETPVDSERSDYELEINCKDPLKGGLQRYKNWKDQKSAVLDGGRIIDLKKIYTSLDPQYD